MPRLTPAQLQEARHRSGRLGGRPRKPTMAEARAAALEDLVPKALTVLREHLESGRPDAWRPAIRILEYAWGRPAEQPDRNQPEGESIDLSKLSLGAIRAMRDRVLAMHPELAGMARPHREDPIVTEGS